MPGSVPNRFFSDSVAPAQWCVFSFGSEIEHVGRQRSSATGTGTPAPSSRPRFGVLTGSSWLRSTNRTPCLPQHVAQAALVDEVLDVPPVPRPLGDDDLAGPLALAQLDDGVDDARVGVDDLVAVVLDQVRLEDDALARERHVLAEVLELLLQDVGERARRSARPGRCGRPTSAAAAAARSRPFSTNPRNFDLIRSPNDRVSAGPF